MTILLYFRDPNSTLVYTLVRLIMTGNIVAGKNNGGINMAELPKNRQI